MHEPFLWPRPHRRGFSFVYAVALPASVHRYATDGPCSTHPHGRLNSRPAALIGGAFLGTFCGRPDPPRAYRIERGGDLALGPARPHRACRPRHLGRRAARERYGDDAMLEASERADQLLDGKARSSSRSRSVTGRGVTFGLFARLPGRLRGRLIRSAILSQIVCRRQCHSCASCSRRSAARMVLSRASLSMPLMWGLVCTIPYILSLFVRRKAAGEGRVEAPPDQPLE